jgi:hypothetical protein
VVREGGEMTQALYAHMNNKTIKKKKSVFHKSLYLAHHPLTRTRFHFRIDKETKADFLQLPVFSTSGMTSEVLACPSVLSNT